MDDIIFTKRPEAADYANAHGLIVVGDIEQGFRCINPPPVPLTIEDYDKAMEDYLLSVRAARGYTTREPSDYAGSSVPRWAQDAVDWISFRDDVMLYSLDVQNTAAAGGPIPTVDEFLANMPEIHWTAE